MKPLTSRNYLIFLMGFLGLGAVGGGLALILSPDGSLIGLPLSLLKTIAVSKYSYPRNCLTYRAWHCTMPANICSHPETGIGICRKT